MARNDETVDGKDWCVTVQENLSFLQGLTLDKRSYTESTTDKKLDTFTLLFNFKHEGVDFTLNVISKTHSRRRGMFAVHMKGSATGNEVFDARWDQDKAFLEEKMNEILAYICGLPDNAKLIRERTNGSSKQSAFAMILDQCARLGI
jgi:hypothetical protein